MGETGTYRAAVGVYAVVALMMAALAVVLMVGARANACPPEQGDWGVICGPDDCTGDGDGGDLPDPDAQYTDGKSWSGGGVPGNADEPGDRQPFGAGEGEEGQGAYVIPPDPIDVGDGAYVIEPDPVAVDEGVYVIPPDPLAVGDGGEKAPGQGGGGGFFIPETDGANGGQGKGEMGYLAGADEGIQFTGQASATGRVAHRPAEHLEHYKPQVRRQDAAAGPGGQVELLPDVDNMHGPDEARTAKVLAVAGQAQRMLVEGGKAVWVPLKAGDGLGQHDIVRTGFGGRVELGFADAGKATIGGGTKLGIDRLVGPGGTAPRLNMKYGLVRLERPTGGRPDGFTVATPGGAVQMTQATGAVGYSAAAGLRLEGPRDGWRAALPETPDGQATQAGPGEHRAPGAGGRAELAQGGPAPLPDVARAQGRRPGADGVAATPIQLPQPGGRAMGMGAVAATPIQLPQPGGRAMGMGAVAATPIQLPRPVRTGASGSGVAATPIQLPHPAIQQAGPAGGDAPAAAVRAHGRVRR